MGWFISQSLVFIVLAFILGVVAGRLWRNAPEKPTEPPAEPDRFERIEGIGPAMANALRAAGISTFTQLAESDDDTKRTALKAAGLSFAPSLVTWSRQARLLADGDEAAFAVLTARLIAGRDTDQQGPRPTPKPTTRPTTKPTPAATPSSPALSPPEPTGPAAATLPPESAVAPPATEAAPPTAGVAPPAVDTAPAGSPSDIPGNRSAQPDGPSAPTGTTPGRTEASSLGDTAGDYSDKPSGSSVSISAEQPQILTAGSEISDSSGAAGTVAVLDRATIIPVEEKGGDTATGKAETGTGNNTPAPAGAGTANNAEITAEIKTGNNTVNKVGGQAGDNALGEKSAEENKDEQRTEGSDQKSDGDKSGTLAVNKNAASKKADRKKNESRKNDGKKGDRKKPGRDSEATNR